MVNELEQTSEEAGGTSGLDQIDDTTGECKWAMFLQETFLSLIIVLKIILS